MASSEDTAVFKRWTLAATIANLVLTLAGLACLLSVAMPWPLVRSIGIIVFSASLTFYICYVGWIAYMQVVRKVTAGQHRLRSQYRVTWRDAARASALSGLSSLAMVGMIALINTLAATKHDYSLLYQLFTARAVVMGVMYCVCKLIYGRIEQLSGGPIDRDDIIRYDLFDPPERIDPTDPDHDD